jgi:hypothetical protein
MIGGIMINNARKVDRMVSKVIAGKLVGSKARKIMRRQALLRASIKYVTGS